MKIVLYILFYALMISIFVKLNPDWRQEGLNGNLKSIAYTPIDDIGVLVLASLPIWKEWKYLILMLIFGGLIILYTYFLGIQQALITFTAFIIGSGFSIAISKLLD